jgi:hypothetical protein
MNQARSLPDIFADLVRRLANLMRTEAHLARVEVAEKINGMATSFVTLLIGATLVIPGLVVLLQEAVAALIDAGYARTASALIIGGVALVIGFILIALGLRGLRSDRLVPTRTLGQLQRDTAVVKQQVSNDHDTVQRAA